MKTRQVKETDGGNHRVLLKITLLLVAGAVLGGAVFAYQSRSGTKSTVVGGIRVDLPKVSRHERAAAYKSAIEQGKSLSQWPQTPEDLIRQFWDAASRKDYAKMALLSPGSVVSDFKTHYDKFTPSPPKEIRPPEPHPKVAGVTVYPVTVPFPWFPDKTLKMAVTTLPDGRLVIDGRNSIWW